MRSRTPEIVGETTCSSASAVAHPSPYFSCAWRAALLLQGLLHSSRDFSPGSPIFICCLLTYLQWRPLMYQLLLLLAPVHTTVAPDLPYFQNHYCLALKASLKACLIPIATCLPTYSGVLLCICFIYHSPFFFLLLYLVYITSIINTGFLSKRVSRLFPLYHYLPAYCNSCLLHPFTHAAS